MKKQLYIILFLMSVGFSSSQDSLEIHNKYYAFLDYTIKFKCTRNGLEWNVPSVYTNKERIYRHFYYILFQGFNDTQYDNVDSLLYTIKTNLDSIRLNNNRILSYTLFFYKCDNTFLEAFFKSGVIDTTISSLEFFRCELKSCSLLHNQKKIESVQFCSPKNNRLPSDFAKLDTQHLVFEDIDSVILTNDLEKIQGLETIALKNIQQVVFGVALPLLKGLLLLSNNKNVVDSALNNLDNFSNLEGLLIEDTKLDSLPSSITTLKHLKRLRVQGVGISKVPDFLCEFKKLFSMSLINLPIKTIPICLSEISSLSYIQIRDTPLLRLSEDLLQEFKRKKIRLILDDGIK